MPRKAKTLVKYNLGDQLTFDALDYLSASNGGQAVLMIREAVELLIRTRLESPEFRARFEHHRKVRLGIAGGNKVTPIRPVPIKD